MLAENSLVQFPTSRNVPVGMGAAGVGSAVPSICTGQWAASLLVPTLGTRLLQNPAPRGVFEAPAHLSTHPARGQTGGSGRRLQHGLIPISV